MVWKEVGRESLRCDKPPAAVSAFLGTCGPRLFEFSRLNVGVWLIALPRFPDGISPFWEILDPDERGRAERFHHSSDCARYVASHAALRIVLAHYAERDPRHIHFVYGRYGKPAIDNDLGMPDIRFNLSHSGDLAVIAVSLASEVGIDIERIGTSRANMAIAERFFSPGEFAALQALPESDQVHGFFSCWTRKEAYVKGRGDGLSVSLSDFDVSLTPGEPPALLGSRIDPSDAKHWHLCDVPVEKGYVTCLAFKSPG